MRSFALDSGNNLILQSDGQLQVVDEGAEVVQHVRSRLLFYRGEAPLDTTQGVPYLQQIFGKPVDLPLAESILKTEILQTPGIAELIDFGLQYDSETRRLAVDFEASTTFGTVVGATINV